MPLSLTGQIFIQSFLFRDVVLISTGVVDIGVLGAE